MDSLFSGITLLDINRFLLHNIVSLPDDGSAFDDLSDDEAERSLAHMLASTINPMAYSSFQPKIYRVFEQADWFSAIFWPFRNWQASRFSDGSFGVWYGSDAVETTVYETVYHWLHGFLADAGLDNGAAVIKRRLFAVSCRAGLLDFRPAVKNYPQLLHKSEYTFTRQVGARMHREGHPGLVSFSVRHAGGLNYALLNPAVLTEPRHYSDLVYRLQNGVISVEDLVGVEVMKFALASI